MTQDLAIHRESGIAPAMSVDDAISRYEMVQQYVQQVLVEGRDYGVIPGTRNKPALLKPGAEKLCAIFGLAVTVPSMQTNARDDFLEYVVTVELVNRAGTPVAQGLGLCNSGERKYRNVALGDFANTGLKMAKKRALTDAVLCATGASAFFEDDATEDAPPRDERNGRQPAGNGGQGQTEAVATPPMLQRFEQLRRQAVDLGMQINGAPPAPINPPAAEAFVTRWIGIFEKYIARHTPAAPPADVVEGEVVTSHDDYADPAPNDYPDDYTPPADYRPEGAPLQGAWSKAEGVAAVAAAVKDQPTDATRLPTKAERKNPHLARLYDVAQEHGLDTGKNSREARLAATGAYYVVASWSDLDPNQANMLADEIEAGRLTWQAAPVAEPVAA